MQKKWWHVLLLLLCSLSYVMGDSSASSSSRNEYHIQQMPINMERKPNKAWRAVEDIMTTAIAEQVFPGCSVVVGSKEGILFQESFGSFTYGIPTPLDDGDVPATDETTLFDMASLSKVVATTSAVMKLYQDGYLTLDQTVAEILGDSFAQQGKETITIQDCLLHVSGFPPDPSPFYCTSAFGCPGGMSHELSFNCRPMIYKAIMAQSLQHAVGEKYVYSDLNFMTLMFVVGTVVKQNSLVDHSGFVPGCIINNDQDAPDAAQCYYERYLAEKVFPRMEMNNTQYLVQQDQWAMCQPAENMTRDTDCQTWQMQGQVSDGNAYALGGIGGHAGLFGNAHDLNIFMRHMMGYEQTAPLWNASTLALFTRVYNASFSSRALGWDTNLIAHDSDLCGNMSAQTFTHTGYTGTQLCGDLGNDVYSVFLTNRVYPTDAQGSGPINTVRKALGNAILNILGK